METRRKGRDIYKTPTSLQNAYLHGPVELATFNLRTVDRIFKGHNLGGRELGS